MAEEAVRPCLRCDTLVEESRAYCPACGHYLSPVKLIVPRPAAAHGDGGARLARIFEGALVVCAALGALIAAAAVRASLP
ncbi:MAG TPA: hypothetical protein VKE69_13995 [Planctomycetota bacterium]|nr:hypothetical protein [Planctomycetota bacterium]